MLKVYATYAGQQVATRQPDPEAAYAAAGRTGLRNDNAYLNATYRTALRRGWSLNSGLALAREHNAVRPEPQLIDERQQTATARLGSRRPTTRPAPGLISGWGLPRPAAAQRYEPALPGRARCAGVHARAFGKSAPPCLAKAQGGKEMGGLGSGRLVFA